MPRFRFLPRVRVQKTTKPRALETVHLEKERQGHDCRNMTAQHYSLHIFLLGTSLSTGLHLLLCFGLELHLGLGIHLGLGFRKPQNPELQALYSFQRHSKNTGLPQHGFLCAFLLSMSLTPIRFLLFCWGLGLLFLLRRGEEGKGGRKKP